MGELPGEIIADKIIQPHQNLPLEFYNIAFRRLPLCFYPLFYHKVFSRRLYSDNILAIRMQSSIY